MLYHGESHLHPMQQYQYLLWPKRKNLLESHGHLTHSLQCVSHMHPSVRPLGLVARSFNNHSHHYHCTNILNSLESNRFMNMAVCVCSRQHGLTDSILNFSRIDIEHHRTASVTRKTLEHASDQWAQIQWYSNIFKHIQRQCHPQPQAAANH